MPPVTPRQQVKPKPKNQTGNTKTIVIIAVVIALAGALAAAYFFYPPFHDLFRKAPEKMAPPPVETVPVDTIRQVIEEPEPVADKIESIPSVEKGFYIIVGSFQQKSNADRMVENLRKDIELTSVYFEETGMYRVSAGRYDNIHKAYNDRYSVADIDGCNNAWVLENR